MSGEKKSGRPMYKGQATDHNLTDKIVVIKIMAFFVVLELLINNALCLYPNPHRT